MTRLERPRPSSSMPAARAPAAPIPQAPEVLAQGSSPMTPFERPRPPGAGQGFPRTSTAPPYPLVGRSGPWEPPPLSQVARSAPWEPPPPPPLAYPAPEPAGERPIAWGRVIVVIAVMSALMGGAIARLAYKPRSAPAVVARPLHVEPAASGVAVLPFENRASDPALALASRELAKVLAVELAAQTRLEIAAPPPGTPPGGAAVLRGSLADHADGGVHLRVELVRRGGKPAVVLDRRVEPAELAAALRAGVPAFAGLLIDPREAPRP